MVNEKKMIKYMNDIGCVMEFEEGISEEEVKKRLAWMGKNWRRVN